MPHDERLVVSVPEAARLLGISRTHAYELIARGELPSIRLGRRILVPLRPYSGPELGSRQDARRSSQGPACRSP
jgi:excisionase family DNA binding protein